MYAPYCGEFNKNASGEADAGPPSQVATLQECAAKCAASADCAAWYLEVGNTTDDFVCYTKVFKRDIVMLSLMAHFKTIS